MKGDRERCLRAGMDGYVPKPLRLDVLFAAIGELLEAPPPTKAPDVSESTTAEGIDRRELLDHLDGNVELLRKMIGLFFEGYPRYLADLEEAVEQSDAEALHRAAHSLKGPVAALSLTRALEWVLQLEDMSRQGDLANARSSCDELAREIDHIRPHLSALGRNETFSD